jgi:hypothetical protein
VKKYYQRTARRSIAQVFSALLDTETKEIAVPQPRLGRRKGASIDFNLTESTRTVSESARANFTIQLVARDVSDAVLELQV